MFAEQTDMLLAAVRFGLEAQPEPHGGVRISAPYYDIETGEAGTDEILCRSIEEIDRAIGRLVPATC